MRPKTADFLGIRALSKALKSWWFRFPELAAETIAFIFSVSLTGFLTYTQYDRIGKELSVSYARDKSALEQELQGRLLKYETMLIQASTWVKAVGPGLNREKFASMVGDLEFTKRFPGALGVGISLRTTPSRLARMERRILREYHAAVKIRNAPSGGALYPIVYFESGSKTPSAALGYVSSNEPKRLRAMELARDTGRIAGSEVVTLPEEHEPSDQSGFILYAPIYSRPLTQLRTAAERAKSLTGFVELALSGKRMLEAIASAAHLLPQATQIAVFVGNGQDQELLYSSRIMSGRTAEVISERDIDVGFRKWHAVFWKTRESYFSESYKAVWITFAIGSLISALICALVWSLKQRLLSQRKLMLVQLDQRAKLETAVAEKTIALTQANRDLLDANHELEAFTYSVSHDLRAPLRGVDGFCQILLEEYSGALDSEAQKFLNFIRQGVQRMGVLIDDLLNLSRISRAPVDTVAIDISQLCQEIVDYLQRENPQANVAVKIAPNLHARGDLGLARILLENLLGNAIKFAKPSGTAMIEIGACPGTLPTVFFVRDNGIGFDARFAGKIFEPFQRLHSEKEFAGTGIGLATCRRVVQRHGGKIWAESSVGSGATFYFTLAKDEPAEVSNPECSV